MRKIIAVVSVLGFLVSAGLVRAQDMGVPPGGTFNQPPSGMGTFPPNNQTPGNFGQQPGGMMSPNGQFPSGMQQPGGQFGPGNTQQQNMMGPGNQGFGDPNQMNNNFGPMQGNNQFNNNNFMPGNQGQFGPGNTQQPGNMMGPGNQGQFGPGEPNDRGPINNFMPGDRDEFRSDNKFRSEDKFNNDDSGRMERGDNQFGDNSEQEDRFEKQRKQQEERSLKQMKQGMKRMGSEMKKMKSRVDALSKKGVTPPVELTTALDKATSIIQQVESATSFETAQVAMEDMQEIGQVIAEGMPQLERLTQLPRVFKEAATQLKRLENDFAKSQRQAARSKIDVSNVINTFTEKISILKQNVADANVLAKNGQAEEAFEKMEGFYESMNDAREELNKVQAVSNFGRYVSEIKRSINNAKRQVRTLQRKEYDVTELNAIIAQAEAKLAEFQSLLKAQPIDPDALFESLSAMEEVKGSFEEQVREISGSQQELPGIQMKGSPQFNYGLFQQFGGAQPGGGQGF